jgi:hypothetical protein
MNRKLSAQLEAMEQQIGDRQKRMETTRRIRAQIISSMAKLQRALGQVVGLDAADTEPISSNPQQVVKAKIAEYEVQADNMRMRLKTLKQVAHNHSVDEAAYAARASAWTSLEGELLCGLRHGHGFITDCTLLARCTDRLKMVLSSIEMLEQGMHDGDGTS